MRGGAALLFTGGAVVAAMLTYSLIGLAAFVPGRWFYLAIALALLFYSAFWHARARSHVPGGRERFQARRDWVTRGRGGLVYFGAVLGVGLLTEMSTPLVHAGVTLAAGTGPLTGLVYGIGFGLGRSTPTWVATALGDRLPRGTVGLTFVQNSDRLRWVGVVASLAGVVVVAGSLWGIPPFDVLLASCSWVASAM